MLVKWEHLESEDLRGNLLSYEIAYYDMLKQQCPAKTYRSAGNTTISVKGGDSYAVISNLDPRLEYCVAVAAKTGAGVGEFSYITIPCMSAPEKDCSLCAYLRNHNISSSNSVHEHCVHCGLCKHSKMHTVDCKCVQVNKCVLCMHSPQLVWTSVS